MLHCIGIIGAGCGNNMETNGVTACGVVQIFGIRLCEAPREWEVGTGNARVYVITRV